MYALSRGIINVISQAIAGPITQPNPKVKPRNFGFLAFKNISPRLTCSPMTKRFVTVNTNTSG
jgi:hypothetical protein